MRKLFPFIFILGDILNDSLCETLHFLEKWSATIVFVIVVLFCLYVGFLVFYPYNPIRIDSLALSTDKARVGEEVCFQLNAEKFMAIPVHASVDLVNGEGIPIENYIGNNSPETYFPKRCFNIPMHVKTNNYRLRFIGIYFVNGFRTITKTELSKSIHITNDIERQGKQGVQGKQGKQGIPGLRGFTGAKGGIVIFGK